MGEGVDDWKKGDRVLVLPADSGSYREYCLVEPHVGTVSVSLQTECLCHCKQSASVFANRVSVSLRT